MSFGERLNSSMKRCGYTNYRLAKSMDVSESTIGYWVKGKTFPNCKQLISLSEKLNVSIDYLLKGEKHTMQEKNFNQNGVQTVNGETGSISESFNGNMNLSFEEQSLLGLFRSTPDRLKNKVLSYCGYLSYGGFDVLNLEIRLKYIDLLGDLIGKKSFRKLSLLCSAAQDRDFEELYEILLQKFIDNGVSYAEYMSKERMEFLEI